MYPTRHFSLKSKNTFGFDVSADYFLNTHSRKELRHAFEWAKKKRQAVFLLGGGSNLVLTRDIAGLTVQQADAVITLDAENTESVSLSATAAVIWHDLVEFCVKRELYGIENLSMIPGSVGAAPIQNIGAYGVELKDVLVSVDVIDISSGQESTVSASECAFGYRDSKFKNTWKNKLAITGVNLRLKKTRQFTLGYTALAEELTGLHTDDLSLKSVSDAVCSIRRRKLPDPDLIGNAGSFFKNPVISANQYKTLQEIVPTVPAHALKSGSFKIPAAWLVDKASWKGFKQSGVGVHKDQAIVLVNTGAGSGNKILQLAEDIQRDIFAKYGIALEIEPVIVR